MVSTQMKAFLDAMREKGAKKKQEIPTEETRKSLDVMMLKQPVAAGFESQDFMLGNCLARRYMPGVNNAEGLILYFHGGGYYTGSIDSHHALMSHLCVACEAELVGLNYRLAPEHPHPAALNDAVAAVHQLSEDTPPSKIMIAGDSAGGGLALACIQALRDSSGILPGCAALISPHIDLSETGAFSDKSESMLWYTGNYSRDHPGASPLFGEMNNLPPTLIHVASDEAHVNEANRLMVKLLAADVRVNIQLFDDAFHVFHMFTEIPESLEAIREIAKFFRQHI